MAGEVQDLGGPGQEAKGEEKEVKVAREVDEVGEREVTH